MAHGKTLELAAINTDPIVSVLLYAGNGTLVRSNSGNIISTDMKRYVAVHGPVRRRRKKHGTRK